MIDHFSLVLGHGLLALVMLRLVMRDGLDVDPALKRLQDKVRAVREAGSLARRRQSRNATGEAQTTGVAHESTEEGTG